MLRINLESARTVAGWERECCSFVLVLLTCTVWSCKDAGSQPSVDLRFQWTIYDVSNSGLPHDWIGCITFDNNNIAWIGTFFNGIARFDGSSWTTFNSSNSGLPSDSVWCLTVDRANHLWIGTTKGLAKFDGSHWTVFTQANSPLPYNNVLSLAVGQQQRALDRRRTRHRRWLAFFRRQHLDSLYP